MVAWYSETPTCKREDVGKRREERSRVGRCQCARKTQLEVAEGAAERNLERILPLTMIDSPAQGFDAYLGQSKDQSKRG